MSSCTNAVGMALIALLLAGCAETPERAPIHSNASAPTPGPASSGNPAPATQTPIADPDQPNPDLPAAGTLTAEFTPGGEDEVIVIRSLDRQAIHSAALVEPDGRVTTAFSIDQSANPSASGEAGAPFAANTPSISPAPDLFARTPPGILNQTDTLIGQTLSAASIRVPDRVLYAKNWRDDRLRVEIGLSSDQRTIVMAAPPPASP